MSITAARQASLLQGQQTIARKVFEVVPILEAWTPNQIDGALRRQTRSSIDFKVLQGCLVALKGAGLIVEPKAGTFQRVAIREKTAGGSLDEAYDEPEEFREVEDARPKGGTSEALQMLADMATHLRSLADDIEAVGLLIAEEAQQNAGSLNKLAQLQTLLKSI